jgi:hypothetical protein
VVRIGLGAAADGDPLRRWEKTFAQALLLGLQRTMYVGPKEVDSFVREWTEKGGGGVERELVLYDAMPGGTGYLRRLVDELPRIAGDVGRHLEACPCGSACYRCLKQFWNQRVHDQLDKRLVLSVLRTLAADTTTHPTPAPLEDVRFESFLEARFYKLLRVAGLPLPKAQPIVRSADGRYIVRADFRYDDPPLVILVDGRAFHVGNAEQVVHDLQQRNEIELAGQRLLEFSYEAVVHSPEEVIEAVRRGLGKSDAVAGAVTLGPAGSWRLTGAAETFATALKRADGRVSLGVMMSVGEGREVGALAVDTETRRVVLWVEPESWVKAPERWARDLDAHAMLRLGGWRVFRVAASWVGTPEGATMISALARLARASR